MDSKLGKWLKRIIIIVIVMGLIAFGVVKLIENKHSASDITAKEKPACDDKRLIKSAQDVVAPFITAPNNTILNKRRNILITKNIDNFTEVHIEKIAELESNAVKARIVELKINKKLDNKNFKICQSSNKILKNKLFLLMYDNNEDIKVEVLNLSTDQIPSFDFYDK